MRRINATSAAHKRFNQIDMKADLSGDAKQAGEATLYLLSETALNTELTLLAMREMN